jgi:hypothetical protein
MGRFCFRRQNKRFSDRLLAKELSLTEHARLRIGMGAFNFFNHTNLSGLVTNINNRFFGELQNTGGARQIQLNARLGF